MAAVARLDINTSNDANITLLKDAKSASSDSG